jgi:hypothetical protein
MTLPNTKDEIPERAIGILALLGSFVLIYLGIYQPISNAANHEWTDSASTRASIIAPLVLALGLTYTVFGQHTSVILGPRSRPSVLGWAFYIFFLILGFVVDWWVQSIVESYGHSG